MLRASASLSVPSSLTGDTNLLLLIINNRYITMHRGQVKHVHKLHYHMISSCNECKEHIRNTYASERCISFQNASLHNILELF
jgi:hypothetical protein